VSGPPNGPPPHLAFGHSSYSNVHNSVPPPSSMPQAFQPPPPGSMSASYPMGNTTGYPNSYDSSPLSDNQFPALVDDGGFSGGFSARGRTLSTGGGGFGPPALVPSAPPMTPYPSHFGLPKRARRASSVGPGMGSGMGSGMGMGMGMGYVPPDMYHRPGGRVVVRFRLKGESRSGITVNEALHRERLSQSQGYLMHDIAPDMSNRITLKVRWSGYHSNTYEIPLSADYNGYVNTSSLARRTARAIVHFMQANGIMLPWDRVVVHRLEEIRPGNWIPVLTTH